MSAVVGRFRVEEKLGEDASGGEVHRAVAIEGGTEAIVHIVRADGGAARRDRLIRETKRAAQLRHEGLATVLEVGETEHGDMFVVVERVEGERLSDRLRGAAPLPEREAATIAAQIARALAAAHDAGVVHRHLRPSLVALSGEGEQTRVKVEGLATPRTDDAELAYGAPEQRRGDTVGRRADVYSIGAMLQAMTTGQPPAVEEGAGFVTVEGPLGDVVRRCLARDPRERFLDTIALGAALRVAMEGPPPPASTRAPVSSSPALTATPPPVTVSLPSSGGSATADRSPPSSRGRTTRGPSPRPGSTPDASASVARPPAAPPPRALGRPLTARPRWEETLRDLSEGPLPRVALTVVVAFVIARVLTSGLVPFVVAALGGVAAYATKYWRGSRGGDR